MYTYLTELRRWKISEKQTCWNLWSKPVVTQILLYGMTVFCKCHLQFQLFYSQTLLCFLFEKTYHAICKTNKTNQQNITTTCYKKDSLAVLSEFSS